MSCQGAGLMISAIRDRLRRLLRPPLHKREIRAPYDFLGSAYGGWPLLQSTPTGQVVFSFGVGEDISFDLSAIKKFGCIVNAFDPTPRSLAWIERQHLPDLFHFHPVGISDVVETAKFFAPGCDEHVSFSVAPSDGSSAAFVEAPVKPLHMLVNDTGGVWPDILKLDIEGFEYRVLDDVLASSNLPEQLLVEFHHGMYGFAASDTNAAVERIRAKGYKLFFVSSSGREYGFVHLSQRR